MDQKYWANVVTSSGGPEDTKNKTEQANLENADWVLEGTRKGLFEIYPDRFLEDGAPA